MPLYEFQCRGKDNHVFDELLPVDRRDDVIKCRFCRAKASRERIVLRGFSAREEQARAQSFTPPVVYKAKDGTYRFPGSPNSKETRRLEARGFERVELRDTRSIRKFESEMNTLERQKYQAFQAGRERLYRDQRKISRDSKEWQSAYSRMTPKEREFADYAMKQNDQKQFAERSFDAGFNIQAFSYDSSNREEHRDVSTGWRGRKY